MKIILLMGTSSVGKSTLCMALKENYQFYIVKNGDEYCSEHLATLVDKLKSIGIMNKLSPPMRPDEIMRFSMENQLNIATAPTPLTEVTIEKFSKVDNQFPGLDDKLKEAGYGEEQRAVLAANLKLAKDVFEADPGPGYEASLEKSFSEALDISNRDKTIVIDFVPESTPSKTNKILDDFTKRAEQFGKDNQIEVSVKRVLIYCPLKKLNENMEARNKKAEETKNIIDKRVGINPILMLSSVATAAVQEEDSTERELMRLSKKELYQIVKNSVSTEQINEQYEQLIGTGDGQWAYGFRFPINEEEVTLKIPTELWFDFKLNNTGNISPVLLAKEIVDKLKFDVKQIVADSTPLSNSKTSVHEEYQKKNNELKEYGITKQYRDNVRDMRQSDSEDIAPTESSKAEKEKCSPLSTTPKQPGDM